MVEEHVAREGGLDVLVNSAGIGIAARVEDAQVKHIDRQLAINLRGLLLVTQAAIPHLRESKGWIVNLARSPAPSRSRSCRSTPIEGGRDLGPTRSTPTSTTTASARSRFAPASSTRRWPTSPGSRARR